MMCVRRLGRISLAILVVFALLAVLAALAAIVGELMEEWTTTLASGLAFALAFRPGLALATALVHAAALEWLLLPVGCRLIVNPKLISVLHEETFLVLFNVFGPVANVSFMTRGSIEHAMC